MHMMKKIKKFKKKKEAQNELILTKEYFSFKEKEIEELQIQKIIMKKMKEN